ncbi:MAG: DUF58 domain-containing protein [Christensenellales bacterium]
MKLIKRVFYTIMAACLLTGLYTGLRVYYIVFFTQFFVIITAFSINLWTVRSFKFQQLISSKKCVKGEETILSLELINERPVPLSLLKVHVDVVSLREKVELTFSLAPFSGRKFEIPIALPYRGKFSVGMTTIKITDIFGLVTSRFDMRRLPYYRMAQVIVLPRAKAAGTISADIVDTKLFGDAYFRLAEHGDSVSGARPYNAGDSAKRINWKKSAQQGALFVKQYDFPERERINILVDTSSHGLADEDALIYADTVCECAASISFHSLLRSRAVSIFADGGSKPVECETLSGFENARHHLALLPFADHAQEDLLEKAYTNIPPAYALFLLTREASPKLINMLESTLFLHKSVTLVLIGGESALSRIHTLYVKAGCNVSECLNGIS